MGFKPQSMVRVHRGEVVLPAHITGTMQRSVTTDYERYQQSSNVWNWVLIAALIVGCSLGLLAVGIKLL